MIHQPFTSNFDDLYSMRVDFEVLVKFKPTNYIHNTETSVHHKILPQEQYRQEECIRTVQPFIVIQKVSVIAVRPWVRDTRYRVTCHFPLTNNYMFCCLVVCYESTYLQYLLITPTTCVLMLGRQSNRLQIIYMYV